MCPQALDCRHHVGWLGGEDFAHLLRPLEIVVHPLDDVGIVGKRLYTLGPKLLVDIRLFAAAGKEAGRQHHIGRSRRGRQNQRDQRVGIQRNRGNQFFDFFRRKFGLVAFREYSSS